LSPLVRFYQPHLTLAKIWLAQDTPAGRQQAAESLEQLKKYAESTHNTVVLIKVLTLGSLLRAAEGDEPAALALLEKVIALAQPGGFVRLFLDLGPPMARLLHLLSRQGMSRDYTSQFLAQVLAAFPAPTPGARRSSPALLEPLTPREMEVLELLAKRLTNKEIAKELVVSPGTVKTHTINIYAKLDVGGRRQAVNKAKGLGLLSPS
jgi:LuxR family maltose regulon positive regulatory protein